MTEAMTDVIEPPVLHPHAVHIAEPRFAVDDAKVKTYDPARAAKAKPDGEDVIPAKKVMRLVDDGSFEVTDVPEVRHPYWLIDNPTRRYLGPVDCPDCAQLHPDVDGPRGLGSRGFDMVCIRLGNGEPTKACHEGCIVACGIES